MGSIIDIPAIVNPNEYTDLLLEKNVVNKIVDIQKLNSEDRAHVFALLDAFPQSHKAKKVFAS